MLSIIHKKHNDRYRIQFCDKNFYIRHQPLFKLWKTRFLALNNVEKLTAWLVALSCLRRPDWYQGKEKCQLPFSFSGCSSSMRHPPRHPLTLAELFKDTPISIPKKLSPAMDLFEFISCHKIKALPEVCLRSLCNVVSLTYPVIITDKIPTPGELLTLQISGQRIISLNEACEEWPHTLYAERDYLGFLIHDLIHAEHFFSQALHRDGQLGVYRFLEKILSDKDLNSLLAESEKFRVGFEYIISDMNSHPLHLFQTLHSLLFSTLKNDSRAFEVWLRWCSLTLSPPGAFARVNTLGFTLEDAAFIESFCISVGQGC